jgi:tetratricopeptide (TPR) repeat protein
MNKHVTFAAFRVPASVSKLVLAILVVPGLAIIAYWWLKPTSEQLYRRGLMAVKTADWSTVADCANRLQRSTQFESHANLLKGFELQSRGRSKEALLAFSKANVHTETREEAYHQAGAVCYQNKQYHECLPLFRQVLQWNPERLDTHQLLAAAYYDIGAMEQAINSLNEVIRISPQDYRPHYMQATILQDFERFGDAALAYEKAARLAPSGTTVADEILAGWGDCLVRLRRYQEALDAMQAGRSWPDILARRAQANFSLRRYNEAIALAEQTLVDSPLHPEAVIVAAQVYERTGELDRSISLLQQTVEKHPYDLRLHHRLADVLGSAGRPDEALNHRNRAGELAKLRAEFAEAHQAAIRETSNAELRLQLGTLAEKLGETEIARNWYQAALGMSPGNKQIQQQWQQFQSQHPLAPKAKQYSPVPQPSEF